MNKKAVIVVLILILTAWYFNFYQPKPQKQNNSETIVEKKQTKQAWVSFSIDNYNETISLHGILGNQKELTDIIDNFATVQSGKNIAHDISINEALRSTDFASNLSLLLALIADVQMAEVEFTSKQIKLTGLVLDKNSKFKIMAKLKQIFAAEFTIINNLELVFDESPEIKNLQFKLPKLPELEL